MNYSEDLQVFIEERVPDGYGGFETTEVELTTLKCRVAPYRVQSGDIYKVPNPTASAKFFVRSFPLDEDATFLLYHNGKRYRKLAVSNFGKVVMIIAERI